MIGPGWRSSYGSGHPVRMSDQAGRSPTGHPLASLPRAWWFPGLPGHRSGGRATYLRYDLDQQPPVPNQDDLGWLEEEAAKPEWSIVGEDNQPVCALTPASLEAVAGSLPVTPALRLLAARGDLQRRIRSATACYLDLGDFAAATSARLSGPARIARDGRRSGARMAARPGRCWPGRGRAASPIGGLARVRQAPGRNVMPGPGGVMVQSRGWIQVIPKDQQGRQP
jgi:hypothetical protein